MGLIFGSLAFLAGEAADGFGIDDLRAVGVIVLLGTFGWLFARIAGRPAHIEYERGYKLGHGDGYHQGHRDGRRIARPVLVGFSPAGDGLDSAEADLADLEAVAGSPRLLRPC